MITSMIRKKRNAFFYYDPLCRLLKIREYGCPEVFRYYFETNGFNDVKQFVVVGDNDFYLRIAETIAEDEAVSVTLLCDISRKNIFPLNQLDYCFDIVYTDLGSDQAKEILNNAIVLSDKRQIVQEIEYFDIYTHLNEIINQDMITKAALDKVYLYFKSRYVNVLYAQIPLISKLSPEGRQRSFADLSADEIENMFNFPGGGAKYYSDLKESIIKTPPPLRKGKRLEFSDFHSPLINRVHGERVIISNPSDYDYTLWILGRCTADSSHTDDMHTIGNILQNMLLNSNNLKAVPKVRAVGMPAVEFIMAINNWYTLEISSGDVVVILSPDRYLNHWEISTEQEFRQAGEYAYYDSYEHCTHKGYQIYAECIYNFLMDDSRLESLNNFYEQNRVAAEQPNHNEIVKENKKTICAFAGNRELSQYKDELKKYKQALGADSKVGSIVMNCNPFTLGHRYLIETALAQVDWLYIFVVEEDKSEFSFEDRIRLVKEGTKDLRCLTIIPSGKFIISSITFPHYFTKGASPDVKVDTSVDVEVFAQHIAPILDIAIRFVGEEPTDNVTRQYNDMLTHILPHYDIDVKIIRRKVNDKGQVISASKVREAYASGNWELIKAMVPECTAQFLKSRFSIHNNI